jgi:hypothetical protein
MSLRELARRHLDSLPKSGCPASGHLGVSGPDKTAKPQVSLGVDAVRTGYSVRTSFQRTDTPSGPDSARRPDKPDNPDALGGLDGPDTRRIAGAVIHHCACGEIGIYGVGWFLREPSRARWYCAACAPTEGRG